MTYLSVRNGNKWLETLKLVSDSYQCTYESLAVDVDWLSKDFAHDSRMGAATLILTFACFNALTITVFLLMDYKMLMRWYKENPLKTQDRFIRTIQVGIDPREQERVEMEE